MILTDEEIETVRNAALLSFRRHQSSVRGQQITQCDDPEYHLICAIESAVLEKLKVQEPAAWVTKHGLQLFQQHEDDVPLFYHPLPPADVVRDAERYKWLRKVAPNIFWDSHDKEIGFVRFDTKAYLWKPEIFDAAIDAAMKEMK